MWGGMGDPPVGALPPLGEYGPVVVAFPHTDVNRGRGRQGWVPTVPRSASSVNRGVVCTGRAREVTPFTHRRGKC